MKNILIAPFRNIRTKTSLFVFFILTITIAVSYLIMDNMMQERIQREVIKRAESLCRNIASTAGYSSFSGDILGLDTLVFKAKESNLDVEDIAIVNPDREILVHSNVNKTGTAFYPSKGSVLKIYDDGTEIKDITVMQGDYFEITSPIIFMNKNLGLIILSVNKSVLYNTQRTMRNRIAWVFVVILLVGTVSSVFLSSFLSRPIRELSIGVAELKNGRESRPLKIYSKDELGRLTESFNEMSALITNQKNKLSKYARDLEQSYISTVKVLAAAIDAKDNYTLGHSTRVARLSVELGKETGLSKEDLEELEIACLFHDVGKIKIPDSILLKDGKLEEKERAEMERHPEYGAEILTKAPSLLKYLPVVRHHHEWYNGTGYPDGLRGEEIPTTAAITSLADVYDAMTSDRPYRRALSKEEALRKIRELSGIQFSPELVKKFVRILRKR